MESEPIEHQAASIGAVMQVLISGVIASAALTLITCACCAANRQRSTKVEDKVSPPQLQYSERNTEPEAEAEGDYEYVYIPVDSPDPSYTYITVANSQIDTQRVGTESDYQYQYGPNDASQVPDGQYMSVMAGTMKSEAAGPRRTTLPATGMSKVSKDDLRYRTLFQAESCVFDKPKKVVTPTKTTPKKLQAGKVLSRKSTSGKMKKQAGKVPVVKSQPGKVTSVKKGVAKAKTPKAKTPKSQAKAPPKARGYLSVAPLMKKTMQASKIPAKAKIVAKSKMPAKTQRANEDYFAPEDDDEYLTLARANSAVFDGQQ